jgi:CHAT domain-containing protein
MLYIFLVNKKHSKIVAARTDSSFMKNLGDFRTLLSDPSHAESARVKFEKYQQVGYDLYRMLVEPVKEYFISGNLLISPDNILSYLPFETFLTRRYGGSDILYRNLSYLMNEYNISYAYSATFMNENITRKSAAPRHLAAFAPAYLMSHRYDTIPGFRNSENSIRDLPYARQEAEYAASSAKGVVFMNDQATETLFKSEAGEYSLIHLAMHALVDDQNPMSSAMLFSSHNDSLNDGLFHTYEVYGTPLQAKMVILSSCNTGSGVLSTGEGILSLARGFLYSGAQSVVMSLWKVDDKAGTDIVKLFYDNLRTGMSKSKALRKARHSYLKNANQLKSHPYFWSTLVIFGDNSPVFARANLIIIAILSAAAVFSVLLIFYFRRP